MVVGPAVGPAVGPEVAGEAVGTNVSPAEVGTVVLGATVVALQARSSVTGTVIEFGPGMPPALGLDVPIA